MSKLSFQVCFLVLLELTLIAVLIAEQYWLPLIVNVITCIVVFPFAWISTRNLK